MASANPKAVVVEDDPTFRELIEIYLAGMGMEVIGFSEGRSAAEKLPGLRPDIVCLDLMLPAVSGYEICEMIRRTPGLLDVPVLMMSSRGQPTDRAEAEEAGADMYLVKPFSFAEFQAAVQKLLARRGGPRGR